MRARRRSSCRAQAARRTRFPADLGRRSNFLEVAAAFAKVGSRIDAVVNNAAHLRYEKIEDVTEETFEKMVNIGLKAAVWGSQALLAHYRLRARRRHHQHGLAGGVSRLSRTPRSTARIKGAIVALTKTLAAELGPRDVRVNAVAPGSVPTPGALQYVDAAEYERRARTIPLRRLGREEDNAQAVAFLLSKEASFINGAVLNVDGGIAASV